MASTLIRIIGELEFKSQDCGMLTISKNNKTGSLYMVLLEEQVKYTCNNILLIDCLIQGYIGQSYTCSNKICIFHKI